MKNPFKEKERLYPVDFGIPMQQKYSVSIKLPEGTSVESVPESVTYKLPDDLATFKFLSEPGSDSVKIVVTLSFNKAIIAAEHYAGLKELYDKVLEKVKQKIILKKARIITFTKPTNYACYYVFTVYIVVYCSVFFPKPRTG
jgi:hypothetical protein